MQNLKNFAGMALLLMGTILTAGEVKLPAQNLIKNPDFPATPIKKYANYHAGPWSWSPNFKDAKIAFDRQVFLKGAQSLRITAKQGSVISVSQGVNTMKPNTRYRLTYYFKMANVGPQKGSCGVKVWFWTGKDNIWLPWNGMTGTADWTLKSFEFKTPANLIPNKTNIRLGMINVTGTVWFDCIGLEELSN